MLPSAPGAAVIDQLVRQHHGGAEHGGAVLHPVRSVDLAGDVVQDGRGTRALGQRCSRGAIRTRHRNWARDAGLQRNEDLVVVLASHGGRAVRVGSVDLRRDVGRYLRAVQRSFVAGIRDAADLHPVLVVRQRGAPGAVGARHCHRAVLTGPQRNEDLVAIGASRGAGAIGIGGIDLGGDVARDTRAVQRIPRGRNRCSNRS